MATDKPFGRVLFWAIAIVALAWNAMGCVNFIQQLSPAGIATLPEEYQTFIEGRPVWAMIGFAVSVVMGVVAAVLLMVRNSRAGTAFLVSGLGALIATIPTLGSGMTSLVIGSAMSVVLAGFFAWYTRRKLG